MKYYLFLLVNCVILLFIALFFADNRLIPESNAARIRNVILLLLFITVSYNLVTIYVLKRAAPETGLVYSVVAGIKAGITGFGSYIQPFKKELIVYSFIAGGLILIGIVLMGMPGGLLLNIPVKLGISKAITGDALWPAALLLSVLWPLCLPAGVFLKNWMASHGYVSLSIAGPALALLIGIPILTTMVYAISK
ncbi:MAG: hypothetical protein QM726_14290 [Chitinophagaceae bacterium]